MFVIISGIILLVYLYTLCYFFEISFRFTSKITADFILQILPIWLLILIVNSLVIYIYPTYLYGFLLFDLIYYTSLGICLLSIVLLTIKIFNKEVYDTLIIKIKSNRNIR